VIGLIFLQSAFKFIYYALCGNATQLRIDWPEARLLSKDSRAEQATIVPADIATWGTAANVKRGFLSATSNQCFRHKEGPWKTITLICLLPRQIQISSIKHDVGLLFYRKSESSDVQIRHHPHEKLLSSCGAL